MSRGGGRSPRDQSPGILVLLLKTDTHHPTYILVERKQNSQLVSGECSLIDKVKRCRVAHITQHVQRMLWLHIMALYAHHDMTFSNKLGLCLHKKGLNTVLEGVT